VPGLAAYSLRVFPQGSYNANTNVRLDSDVDVCVLCTNAYYSDFTFSDLTRADLTDPDSPLRPAPLRAAIQTALIDRFGSAGVTRGNKAFDVHANTYRLDADVVVAFQHRRFAPSAQGGLSKWDDGIQIFPDQGESIINWPRQTYENGVAKNDGTSRRYKATIRILKRVRNAMQEDGIADARDVGSFLIESLVWNVPDDSFATADYRSMIENVLVHTFSNTSVEELCSAWREVNELKYLFRPGQPWTRERANRFIGATWEYLGYK
jgi:hypothetical protein